MSESCDSLIVSPATENTRSLATAMVFQDLPEADRAELLETLLRLAVGESNPFAGLLEARRDGVLVGAVWAQLQPGHVAVLWPPGTAKNEPTETCLELLSAAAVFLEESGVTMAQTLLGERNAPQARELEQAGFSHFADLHYMACTQVSFPSRMPSSEFSYLAYSPALEARFRSVIEQTYEGTLDCPALNGVRPIDDVLVGYRSTGVFRAENWKLVVGEECDLACLMLADHPSADQLELVYMGVVRKARGKRLGYELTRYAQWIAHCAGRSRLVLAVDTNNRPAIDAYLSAGLFAWDRRSVFLRTFPTPE